MLVLSRKTEETIHIGDQVVIKVISLGGGRVKIGIDAPISIRVMRGEMVTTVVNAADAATDVECGTVQSLASAPKRPSSQRIERMVTRSGRTLVH